MAFSSSCTHRASIIGLFTTVLSLFITSPALPAAPSERTIDQPAFERALAAYESGAKDLLKFGNSAERAAAIKGLAALGSPAYQEARDVLLPDQDLEVRIALLDAMGLMGDTSPQVLAYLERALASEDHRISLEAIYMETQYLHAPLSFRNLWLPEKATFFWAEYIVSNGWPCWDLINGIGEVRPWLDPAWAQLADTTRSILLFRAGTQESVALGIKQATAQTPAKWWGLIPAEPVNLPFMRQLLEDQRTELRQYAARTLLAARDPAFLAGLSTLVREYHGGIANIPDSALDNLAVNTALPLLGDSELTGLLMDDPAKWYQGVFSELEKRGKPISYTDLRGRRQPSPLFDIGRIPADILRGYQLRALLRENVYEDLSSYIDLAFISPNVAYAMSELAREVANARSFRATIPPAIAKTCQGKLQDWLRKSPMDGGPPATNPNGAPEAKKLALMLASADERDAAWQKVRSSKAPFKEIDALQVVLWGCDDRADALRAALATHQGTIWFHSRIGYPTLDALQCVVPDSRPRDPCLTRGSDVWLPVPLPVSPSSFKALRDTFADAVARSGASDEREFARAFLMARGIALDEADPAESAHWLAGPNVAIRTQSLALLANSIRMAGLSFPQYAQAEECRRWVETYRFRLAVVAVGAPQRLPSLAPGDSAWLESILRKERQDYFESLVDNLIHPKPSGWVSCPGPPSFDPAAPGVSGPSETFIGQAGMEFEPEIRALLGHPEPVVRHAAAWALWQMLRDPTALEVFKRDQAATDPKVKASALYMAVRLRRHEDSALFLPLLSDKEPVLRQVGLASVQGFSLQEALPDVLSLVADQDMTVSSMAIDTLGNWHPREAQPLLLKLVLGNGPQAGRAAMALTHYRSTDDLDLFLATASAPDTPDVSRVMLIGVISRVTGRMGLQLCDPFQPLTGKERNLNPAALSDWQSWWKNHRKESPEVRLKAVIGEQVKIATESKDEMMVGFARRNLAKLDSKEPCLVGWGPTTPECSGKLVAWWEKRKIDSAWSILTEPNIPPWTYLDNLWDLDPRATRRLVFSAFNRTALGDHTVSLSNWSSSYPYSLLVRYSGVDFGDPGPARCGTKDRILADWLAWARREGWAE